MGSNEYLFERRYKSGIEKGTQPERIKAEEEKLEFARELKDQKIPLEVIAKVLKISIKRKAFNNSTDMDIKMIATAAAIILISINNYLFL